MDVGNVVFDGENDFGKLLENVTKADLEGMIFSSLEDAESFYQTYAQAKGFSVRIRNTRRPNGTIKSRKWVCSKEGVREEKHMQTKNRQREPRDITRCFCPATFRVKIDSDGVMWRGVDFVVEHNHELLVAPLSQYLRSHRLVTTCDLAQINSMRYVGIRPTHIMKLMIHQAGSASAVGYTDKDLRNSIHKHRAESSTDNSVREAFGYMKCKQTADADFTFDYTIDDGGRLGSLFWCDGISKIDYQCFGDVVAFDSTHDTNKYGKPFVLLVGINHHYQTCIFGCALLHDQTERTFVWLLQNFSKAMGGKNPPAVLTDGDKAIENAIELVFPDCKHRVCAWHVMRNANSKVQAPGFLKAFKGCMFSRTEEDFNNNWAELVQKYNLSASNWALMMFDSRARWADAFFLDFFFGRQRANQRSESMNHVIKLFLNKQYDLLEFVQHFDTALAHVRHKEVTSDFDTVHGTPVLVTHLRSLERHATNIYTRATLKIFRKELKREGEVITVASTVRGDTFIFLLNHFDHPVSYYQVEYNIIAESLKCTCKLFESTGFPCRHMIHVMKTRQMTEIPESCILRRWTKNAKAGVSVKEQNDVSNNITTVFRHGSLSSQWREVCSLASKSTDNYKDCKKVLSRLATKYKPACDQMQGHVNVDIDQIPCEPMSSKKVRKMKACSKCKQPGHYKSRCTVND